MFQSVLLHDHAVPPSLLWKNCPENRVGDFDYLVELLDWELNVDPLFERNRFMAPKPTGDAGENADDTAASGTVPEPFDVSGVAEPVLDQEPALAVASA